MSGPPQATPPQDIRSADSYLRLRQGLGYVGTLLPFVLVLGNAFLRSVLYGPFAWRGWDLQRSMSAYYYTDMKNVFVGALCAIGAFLLSDRGESKKSACAGTVAGLCAIGAGLFPTFSPRGRVNVVGEFHIGFAAVLYLTLAYFSLIIFADSSGASTRRQRHRKRLYRICGYTIIVCLALIAVAEIPAVREHFGSYDPGLWFECGATLAFGISWLTRGEKILRDVNPRPN